jgi:glyoxylase-like metal-dependent hydrolase (beta-lactamase superfamily II)
MNDDQYEIHALRYFSRGATRQAEFFRYELYGEPERAGPFTMDYFFWLVRNESRTVLIDCGFDRGRSAARGRIQESDPRDLLRQLGVSPEAVDHIVVTHMHYDHVGNAELFPNATFTLARDELQYWAGPFGRRNPMTSVVYPEEVQIILRLAREERVTLLDSPSNEQVVPGISVTQVGGHTPGQLIVTAQSENGSVVLASDAMHYFEEIELDRPYNLYSDLEQMYRGYDLLRALDERDDVTLVAGHDPKVRALFEMTAPDCFDLGRPRAR